MLYQLEGIFKELYLLRLLFLAYLILVALIDTKQHRIPWITNLIGIPIALSVGFSRAGLVMSIIGGVSNGIFFLALYFLGKKTAYFARRSADGVPLGLGDVLFSGILGLALGFPGSYLGVLGGSLLGLAFILILWIVGKLKGDKVRAIPYAPFLALGTWIVMFFL